MKATAKQIATIASKIKHRESDFNDAKQAMKDSIERSDSSTLATLLDRLAQAEGVLAGWKAFSNVTEATDKEQVMAHLASLALRDTDDRWSGRTNDAKRSFMDGFRTALKDVLTEFTF